MFIPSPLAAASRANVNANRQSDLNKFKEASARSKSKPISSSSSLHGNSAAGGGTGGRQSHEMEENVSHEDGEGEGGATGDKESSLPTGGRTRRHTILEGDLEIIFEAHAPKIIIPTDSSAQRGYLLLDTGYLVVRGVLSSSSMTWDVKLSDVNAAMPKSVKDMYAYLNQAEQSLYLIKPFDVHAWWVHAMIQPPTAASHPPPSAPFHPSLFPPFHPTPFHTLPSLSTIRL